MTPLTDLFDALVRDPGGGDGSDGDSFTGPTPAEWAQGRAIFGGVISGHALRALRHSVPADRALRSALVSFIGPVAPGSLMVRTRVLRAGRAMTQAEARVFQNGDEKAIIIGAYGAERPTRLVVEGAAMPADIPTEAGIPMTDIQGVMPPFTRGFDYRWDPACVPFSGAKEAVVRGSVRLKGAPSIDEAGVLALLDAWPAPILSMADRPLPASTVTWMVDMLAPMPNGGWDPAGWWRFCSDTPAAGGGYADISGRIWAPDGTLVAASRQLVAEFSARA